MPGYVDRQLSQSVKRTAYREITLIHPLRTIGLLLLLVGFALALPVATGQRLFAWGPSVAAKAYAIRMRGKADNAARELDFISSEQERELSMRTQLARASFDGLTFEAAGLLARRGGDAARRFADDFDVVPPPAGLERAHQQTMEALRQWITATRDSAFRASFPCKEAPRSDPCGIAWASAAARRSQARTQYWLARNRAAALLREQRVAISDVSPR